MVNPTRRDLMKIGASGLAALALGAGLENSKEAPPTGKEGIEVSNIEMTLLALTIVPPNRIICGHYYFEHPYYESQAGGISITSRVPVGVLNGYGPTFNFSELIGSAYMEVKVNEETVFLRAGPQSSLDIYKPGKWQQEVYQLAKAHQRLFFISRI